MSFSVFRYRASNSEISFLWSSCLQREPFIISLSKSRRAWHVIACMMTCTYRHPTLPSNTYTHAPIPTNILFGVYSPSLTKFCSFKKLVVSLNTEVVGGLPPADTKLLDEPSEVKIGEERGTRDASSLISAFWFWRRLREVQLFLLAALLVLWYRTYIYSM